MYSEWQILMTLIEMSLFEKSDLALHCFLLHNCLKTLDLYDSLTRPKLKVTLSQTTTLA